MNNLLILLAERRMDRKVEDVFKKLLRNPKPCISTLFNHGVFLFN